MDVDSIQEPDRPASGTENRSDSVCEPLHTQSKDEQNLPQPPADGLTVTTRHNECDTPNAFLTSPTDSTLSSSPTSSSETSSLSLAAGYSACIESSPFTSFSDSSQPWSNMPRLNTSFGARGALRNSCRDAKVQRFDGHARSSQPWDSIRRDEELWFADGDCLVYFYSRGTSRRGPSLRLPFESLKAAKCGPLFTLCFAQKIAQESPSSGSGHRSVNAADSDLAGAKYEIYIPSPDDRVRRKASFNFHLTTRNFFAWMFDKPVVGTHLGHALLKVFERMTKYRDPKADNGDDLVSYMNAAGYSNFTECPDHALASLYLAEEAKLTTLWIDAFAHAVGMNEDLCMSSEFENVTRVTKALITRAALDMDLHQTRVARSLTNFLEEETSASFVGLSDAARSHLDRFRTFLQGFYVGKYGYWPPPDSYSFSKNFYRSLYFEFRSLYDFLVDTASTESMPAETAVSGGVCVWQNLHAFDARHKFEPLPHRFPLLPKTTASGRAASQKGLRSLKKVMFQSKSDRISSAKAAFAAATNKVDIRVTACPLVREFSLFEKEWLQDDAEKISMHEARNIRWLLVYKILQMLISVTRAPKEVRDAESPSYSLSCRVPATPFKKEDPIAILCRSLSSSTSSSSDPSTAITVPSDGEEGTRVSMESHVSIHPDCETEDYFRGYHSRKQSVKEGGEVPSPLNVSRGLLNRLSRSATRHSRASSIKRSLSRHFSNESRSNVYELPSPLPSPSIIEAARALAPKTPPRGRSLLRQTPPVADQSQPQSSITTPVLHLETKPFNLASPPTKEELQQRKTGTAAPNLALPSTSNEVSEIDAKSGPRTPTLEPFSLDSMNAQSSRPTTSSGSTSKRASVLRLSTVSFKEPPIADHPAFRDSVSDVAPVSPTHRYPSCSSTYSDVRARNSPVSPVSPTFSSSPISPAGYGSSPALSSPTSDYFSSPPGLSYSSASSVADEGSVYRNGKGSLSNESLTAPAIPQKSHSRHISTSSSVYSANSAQIYLGHHNMDMEQYTRGRARRRVDDAELAAQNGPKRPITAISMEREDKVKSIVDLVTIRTALAFDEGITPPI